VSARPALTPPPAAGRGAPLRWVIVTLLLVVTLAAVAVGLRFSAPAAGTAPSAAAAAPSPLTSPPPPPVRPQPAVTPVAGTAPAPAPAPLAAALAPLTSGPTVGTLTGRIIDPITTTVLWDSGGQRPQVPASTAKLLTAAAALLTLPLTQSLVTRVVRTSVAGQVAILGGGDPTLSGQPVGAPTYYPGAARLDDLVAQVKASGTAVSSVVVDTSRWSGPGLAQGWLGADVAGGFIAPAQALMLDGARLQPLVENSPRSPAPAMDAGRVFAQRLGLPPSAVTAGTAPAGATELAAVRSAPLGTRLAHTLVTSDNVAAEAVAREVALARGLPPTFAGSAEATSRALSERGVDTTGLQLQDGSGLSTDNRVPARLLADVLSAAAGGGPLSAALRPMLGWLPIAGVSGTLANRFRVGAPAAPSASAGWVRAKTGTLTGVSTLAGVVTDVDGRVLVFVLMSSGGPTLGARPGLDAVATLLRSCGCR